MRQCLMLGFLFKHLMRMPVNAKFTSCVDWHAHQMLEQVTISCSAHHEKL